MVVTDEQITAYLPTIKTQARKYRGQYGAELDDLIQEGMIAVWLSLRSSIEPTGTFMAFRMKNWVRLCHKEWTFERIWELGLQPQRS